MIPEHLNPEEVREELESCGVVGITGVAEQRRALKTVLKEHVDQDVESGVSGPDEFPQHARKVSVMLQLMKLSGSDPYAMRVLYSRWALW